MIKHAAYHHALWLFMGVFCVAFPTGAQVPTVIPIQGHLTGAEGTVLQGLTDMTFTIYGEGDEGDVLVSVWTAVREIEVEDGHFSAYLGEDEPLDLSLFEGADRFWLGVTVADGEALDPIELGTAPYAARCRSAATLDGLSVAELSYDAGEGLVLDARTFSVDRETIEGWVAARCYDSPEDLAAVLDARYRSAETPVPWAALVDVPPSLADGDDDTQLTEAQVDGYVADDLAALADVARTGQTSALVDMPAEACAEGQLLVWDTEAMAWICGDFPVDDSPVIPADGSVTADALAPQAVTTVAIAAGAVARVHLADGAVGGAKIADGAVQTAHLAPAAVTAQKLADGAVGTDKIGVGAVTGVQLADNTITTAHLTPGAVTTAQLAFDAVTNQHLAGSAVEAHHIREATVTGFHLADNAIDGRHLIDGVVSSAKLVNAAVDTQHIAAAAVTGPQLALDIITSDHLVDGAVSSTHLVDGAVEAADIAVGAVTTTRLADGSVSTEKLTDGAVGTVQLAQSAVTSAQLADGAVSSTKLADGAVERHHLALEAVDSAQLADGAVGSAKLVDGSVGTPQLALSAVTGPQLAEGSLERRHFGAGIVGSLQIADEAVTTAKLDPEVTAALVALDRITGEHVVDGSLSGADISATADLSVRRIYSTGHLRLGNDVFGDGIVGDIELYDTGNNRHRTYGVGPNAFLTTLEGTNAIGQWEMRDFSVDVSTGDFKVSAGDVTIVEGAVSVGTDPPAGTVGIRCVPGEPCTAIQGGNLVFTGGGQWSGANPDNAAILFDYTGTGWGRGNKVIRLVDRDGEEAFSVTHGGRMNWKPDIFMESFCDVPAGAQIPGSEDAIFCALSRVDDDTPGGYCQVYRDGDRWMYRTGGNCGANACTAMCMR